MNSDQQDNKILEVNAVLILSYQKLEENLDCQNKKLVDLLYGYELAHEIIQEYKSVKDVQKNSSNQNQAILNFSKELANEYQNILYNIIDNYIEIGRNQESFEIIKKVFKNNPENPENIWRMARGLRDKSSRSYRDKKLSEKYLNEAFDIINKGKKQFPKHGYISLWYGCILELKGRLEGINTRIKNSFIVLENFNIAVKEIPEDFLTNHALGTWHFEVSNIPYAKRMLAKTIFSVPPTSDFKTALPYLEKAFNIRKDNPYAGNLINLTKCHYNLGNYKEAKKYAAMVLNLNSDDEDTLKAQEEAKFYA